MTAKVFLDTNILVYAATGTGRDERKRQVALSVIESEKFGTSAQVLQEFFVTVVKKAARPLSSEQALEWIEELTAFPSWPIDHPSSALRSNNPRVIGSLTGTQPSFPLRKLWNLKLFIPRISMMDNSMKD